MKYEALDCAILTAVQEGKRDFTSIAYNADIEALAKPHARQMMETFRVVDRRLQALRKRGLIEFTAKKWHLATRDAAHDERSSTKEK